MADQNTIDELIQALVKPLIEVQSYPAEVVSVDTDNETCKVKPIGNRSERGDVRLTGVIKNKNSRHMLVPKVGSAVVVGIMDNNPRMRFLQQYSEIEKIVIDCEEVVYNDGNNGGLVNWPDAKAELDKEKARVDAIIRVLTTWSVTPNDGGAALLTLANSQLTALQKADYDNKEDTKIKH